MIPFRRHDLATCPECNESLYFGAKEEASGWKVYYECECGWERMAGWVKLSDIEHQDEVHDRAQKMGEQWAGP